MTAPVAILIVNGGQEPAEGRWLELCVNEVRKHTCDEPYHLYVWNNYKEDPWVRETLTSATDTTLVNHEPMALPKDHPAPHSQLHAMCLQRLYETARANRARHILTLDTDAHPIRAGWLKEITGSLNQETVLAGVWRDELSPGIRPYVHASCLCTTVEFIEKHNLRLDFLPAKRGKQYDTLSVLTEKAQQLGLNCHPLRRSNRNQLHRLMNGIYGDLIYHHAAGSRPRVSFWDEASTRDLEEWNQQLRNGTTALLFRHHDQFIDWLRGNRAFQFVLGMHRSGTSCLAGALEQCGLFLGEVSRANPHNARGNHELTSVINLHDRILEANGASWLAPPTTVRVGEADQHAMREVVRALSANAPCGLKEPRMLLFLQHWLGLVAERRLVGTFRHPTAVAQSLTRRNKMPAEQAHELWLRYNERLIELHRQHAFPLLNFDLRAVDAYCETVASVAVRLGLDPKFDGVREFVSRELDHSETHDQSVPSICQEAYQYLLEHRYQPEEFEKLIVKLARARDQRQSGTRRRGIFQSLKRWAGFRAAR